MGYNPRHKHWQYAIKYKSIINNGICGAWGLSRLDEVGHEDCGGQLTGAKHRAKDNAESSDKAIREEMIIVDTDLYHN